MSSKLKIGLLVAVHVVAGLVLAWNANPLTFDLSVPFIGLLALVFAEAGLLGIWSGLSTTRFAWRFPAVVAVAVYLWAVFVVAVQPGDRLTVYAVIVLTAVPILVVLSCLRHGRRRLRLAHLANRFPASEGFQFSIRHLLLVTTFVAVVLGIGRGVRTISITQSNMVAVATFPPCFIMVELATLWAALGLGRPLPRLAVVVPTAFVVGAIPGFYLPGSGILELIIWPVVVGLQAIITACSLLVFRSCGWRLVRGTVGGTNAVADEERAGSEPLPTPPGP